MKAADVRIGAVYRCKVSEQLVSVTVLAQTERRARVAFTVRNEATGRVLVKSAAQLRPAQTPR